MSVFLQEDETDFLSKSTGSGLSSIFDQSPTKERNEDLRYHRASKKETDSGFQQKKSAVKNVLEGKINQPKVYMVDVYCYKPGSDGPINMGKGGLTTVKSKNGGETLILYKSKQQPLVAMAITVTSNFDLQNDTFGFFRFNSTAWSLGFASAEILREFATGFANSKAGNGEVVQVVKVGDGEAVTENKVVSIEMKQGDHVLVHEFLAKADDWTAKLIGKKVMCELFLHLDSKNDVQWLADNFVEESGYFTMTATILEISDIVVEPPEEKVTAKQAVIQPEPQPVQEQSSVQAGTNYGSLINGNTAVIDMLLTEQRLQNIALLRLEQKLDKVGDKNGGRDVEVKELKAENQELTSQLEIARRNFKEIEETLSLTQKELSSVKAEIQMIILAHEKEEMIDASCQTETVEVKDNDDELTKRILKSLFKRVKSSLKSSGSDNHSTEEVLNCMTEQIRQII